MLRTLFVALCVFSAPALADSAFCDGFEAGFAAGYCDGNSMCMAPISPICPIPPIGQDGFSGGYAVGFRKGMIAKGRGY